MQDVTRLSNVDLLEEFHAQWDAYGMGDNHYEKLRNEVLRRMDVGIANREDVAPELIEHQR